MMKRMPTEEVSPKSTFWHISFNWITSEFWTYWYWFYWYRCYNCCADMCTSLWLLIL